MKKLLIMTNTLYTGGAERVLQTVLNHLDEHKYDITLYSMHRENIDTNIFKKKFHYKVVFDEKTNGNIMLRVINKYITKFKGIVFKYCSSRFFYFLFIREKYDIEVAFIEGESTKIIAGSNNKTSKKIAWVHIDLEKNPWTSFLYRGDQDEAKHYEYFDKIICVSNATKEAFCRKYNFACQKVIVHYNPIDVDYILEESRKSEDLSDFSSNIVQVIAVGRLVEQKGYDRLLIATKKLILKGVKFKLHIIGDGTQYQMLNNYILENGLQKYVILHGYQSNPYTFMKKGDILVCSSRAEGYSLVIAEAMILGLAVVTTSCSGPCELVDNGRYGVLVENSIDGICTGLNSLLCDKSLLERYKSLSIERSSIFNIDENINKLEELLHG